jgi:acetyltransferase-like isoleucine patch superfamily enzyme
MLFGINKKWIHFWMKFDPLGPIGRFAGFLAAWPSPPYKARCFLSHMNPKGYISHRAQIGHQDIILNGDVFIGDNVIIHQASESSIILEKGVQLYRDIIIETGDGAQLIIDEETHIQPRCSIMAYVGSIHIGKRVEIAPNCAFYPYNHGIRSGIPVRNQKCSTKGGIFIDDDAWLGFGVIVLDGVRIGSGAVVGAGSLVTKDIPSNAIAYGVPARVERLRKDLKA